MSTPTYFRFQVKSSGKWLKILHPNNAGSPVGQGNLPINDNYLWQIRDSDVSGWSVIQSMGSGQYLNIQGGGNANDTVACQNSLPSPNPENFLWQILAPDENGWSKIQVKNNTPLFLNIRDGKPDDDAEACQGNEPTRPNFLWIKSPFQDPIAALVELNFKDCSGIYALPNKTKLTADQARNLLSIGDANNWVASDPNTFETSLNPGSMVTWRTNVENFDTFDSGYQVAITNITYEQANGGTNVLGPLMQYDGRVETQVLWTAIPSDIESYTITFTVDDGTSGPHTYSIDPKIKINPSN